ncbi:hypothetical protein F4819DRAFT_128718 [Hypoxylon fuscum]|nr:hypothetical protein F4819DRAFT_128718 [Hypoxylon fuscum]
MAISRIVRLILPILDLRRLSAWLVSASAQGQYLLGDQRQFHIRARGAREAVAGCPKNRGRQHSAATPILVRSIFHGCDISPSH